MEEIKINNSENFAKILILLRETENLTKKELSSKLGIKYTTYNNYEIGRNEPSINNLINIANFFQISIDYLVGRPFANEYGYLTAKEKNILEVFRSMTESNQDAYYQEGKGILLAQNLK